MKKWEEEITKNPEKSVIYITEMLTEPSKGIYTRWTYYSDGTVKEEKIPKGSIIIPINFNF